MRQPDNIEYRVPSPDGRYIGVRVTRAGAGWWFGRVPAEYDAHESRLEAMARAKIAW